MVFQRKCMCVCVCQIKDYEKLDSEEERLCRSRQIYDGYIMKELLSCSHAFSKKAVDHVQTHLAKKQVPPSLFQVRNTHTNCSTNLTPVCVSVPSHIVGFRHTHTLT
ncbi:unnamed protein product [Oncorhynchus mykiss]|uniref:RGS domain-containing protein n=1 Tax=Oncorhynchus mykiss TaxID=8022 RepID=A0A060Y665_ONCMY|nr:unnamed protein product [Oncorhynchus mykiss]